MGKVSKVINKTTSIIHIDRKIKLLAAMLAVCISIILIKANSYTENIAKGIESNLIRLHVVANSDSPEDQQLKRDVRDSVLAYMHDEVKDSSSIEQTKAILAEKLGEISAVAECTLIGRGSNYKVETSLGNYPFPTKMYGDIVLPAGNYQALRIVIGDGEGANWWCVLFPPLCFVDVTHGTVPDSAREDLQAVLTDEEYRIVTSSDDNDDLHVKIKFKIVEVFQDSKIKLAGAIGDLFGPGDDVESK